MADVVRPPLVRCDNCSRTAEKVAKPYSDGSWLRPDDWGEVRVAPTTRGMYPNPIAMTDLCPPCLQMVHDAVGLALAAGRAD